LGIGWKLKLKEIKFMQKINYDTAEKIDITKLVDIKDVKIDVSLPKDERVKSYIAQIKNPYCYRYDDTIVRISYADTDVTLKDRMMQYLLSSNAI
jgi:hypothetical protein